MTIFINPKYHSAIYELTTAIMLKKMFEDMFKESHGYTDTYKKENVDVNAMIAHYAVEAFKQVDRQACKEKQELGRFIIIVQNIIETLAKHYGCEPEPRE